MGLLVLWIGLDYFLHALFEGRKPSICASLTQRIDIILKQHTNDIDYEAVKTTVDRTKDSNKKNRRHISPTANSNKNMSCKRHVVEKQHWN